ncbi:PadR family transcriptional regulator [Bremerella sp. JC770]|uniref:PadR family transcriptional regulator n=1 Tax=Bremerella sp. JC770 TaxID=3232137 RepID=UPI00345A54C4
MALPQITHLQFLILDLIRMDDHSGRYIRERLREEGEKKSAPSFYQLMARLQDGGYVTGWYEAFNIDGQTIKERRYQLTPKGRRVLREVRKFYAERGAESERNPHVAVDPEGTIS